MIRTEKDEGGDKVWREVSSPIYVFPPEEYVGTFFPSSMRFRQSKKGAKDGVGLRLCDALYSGRSHGRRQVM